MDWIVLIGIITVCILLEGFFSGSELALVVADKLRLKNRADQGNTKAKMTLALVDHPRWFFSVTLLGTNVCVVTASTVLTFFIIRNYGEDYSALAILISPVILIFGEILPKSVYQHHANFLATRIGVLLAWASYLLYPLVWLLSQWTQFLLRGVEKASRSESRISRDELALILASEEVEGSDMPAAERRMVRRVLELSDKKAEDIMIPLVEVEMLPAGSDTEAALSVFDLKGLSHLLVFEHRSHNIVGRLGAADCFFATHPRPLKEMMKEVTYVPEMMPVYELYDALRKKREPVAIVVDEYGGATGVVTLEDLLEEVVGDIKDEYELARQHFKSLGRDHYLVAGRMEVAEANETLKLEIPPGDYETVAGFVIDQFGSIPKPGETFPAGSYVYTVKSATSRAVHEVEVKRSISDDRH